MAEYLHGTRVIYNENDKSIGAELSRAMVFVGTAPVQTLKGGAANVNKPVVVHGWDDAVAAFGYSDDWAKFSLCEVMAHYLKDNNAGEAVFINVLDMSKHLTSSATTASVSIGTDGKTAVIANAQLIYMDGLTVTDFTEGTDYTKAYDRASGNLILTSTGSSWGTNVTSISVSYKSVDITALTNADVIGSSDNMGTNTGLYAIRNVYQMAKRIPALLCAPGFSETPAIHTAMLTVSRNINGHWDAVVFADMPIIDGSTPITLGTAYTWKTTNGYTGKNEKVFFPLAKGTDGKTYHLSTLAATNMRKLLNEADDIPYQSVSNTECAIISNLYLGAGTENRVYDDTTINAYLDKYGICSACYHGGAWVLWGAHTAEYDQETENEVNIADTNVQMMFYLGNDFQVRHAVDIDKPKTPNDMEALASYEQARLDALVSNGMLSYGKSYINAKLLGRSDIVRGDHSLCFDITPVPLTKSLTLYLNRTEDGYEAIYTQYSA